MHPIIQAAFAVNLRSGATWGLAAHRLKQAGDVVFDRFRQDADRVVREEVVATQAEFTEMPMPASLLYGLALENLLKAIIIDREPTTAAGGLPRQFRGPSGHNLPSLAKRAGLDLSQEEKDLARRLTAYVEWAGRYPVPTRAEGMTIKQDAVGGAWLPLPLQLSEVDLYEALFARADAVVFPSRTA